MKRGRLTVARHGEAISNAEGWVAGWRDAPLTEKGEGQGRMLGELLRGYTYDRVYSSKLSRARSTIDLALGTMGATNLVVATEAFNERSYGVWNGAQKEDVPLEFITSFHARPPHGDEHLGESYADVRGRVADYYDSEIVPRLLRGEVILIGAHNDCLRTLVMHIESLSEEEFFGFRFENATPLHFVMKNGTLVRE